MTAQLPPEAAETAPAAAVTAPPVLAVDGLTVTFDAGGTRQSVVDALSLRLWHGRTRALVGGSGSGKSVTAAAVLGLLPPAARAAGSVTLEGRQLLGAPERVLRRVRGGRIGAVFQEPMSAFNPVYTIGNQIAEALTAHRRPDASGHRRSRAALRQRVAALLASVGIRDGRRIAASYPHELSGGQLQRAMIAMAISADPAVLIADEPTTALDVTVQAGILDLLRTLQKERDMAVLLITHDMGVVADLADDVSVLHDGRIVEDAPVHKIFAEPASDYTRMLLAAVPRIDTPATRRATPAPAAPAVDVRHVSVVYGAAGHTRRPVLAVDDVSFSIPAGRTLGLVGESGSGKSTLGRVLAGLVAVRSGTACVGGIDAAHAGGAALRRLRRGLGYVFQDPAASLNPRFSVGRAIAEPLRLHTRQGRAGRERRVAELLEAVRLPAGFAARYPHELSGGQRQRVALARAVALRPAVLIADEPTSALDVAVQAQVLALLTELQQDFGFACLFITHDLAVAHDVADEIAVMRAGRIVEAGPADRVLREPAETYTKRLVAAAPVPDPDEQHARRLAAGALV